MTAIASYIRHLIVTGILVVIERATLPIEGSEDAANAIALFVIGTITWAFVKYAPELAKRFGITPLIILAAILTLPSCADSGYPLTGRISYLDPETGAKGGLVFEPGKAPRASVSIPVYDDQGKLIGIGQVSGPLAKEINATK